MGRILDISLKKAYNNTVSNIRTISCIIPRITGTKGKSI